MTSASHSYLEKRRTQARLRMRRWLAKPANKAKRARYQVTARAKKLDRLRHKRFRERHKEKLKHAMAEYARSEKGRIVKLQAMAKFRKTEKYKKWRRNERRMLGLPAWAPKDLVVGFKLLRTLKQEKRKWTSTN